MMNEGIYSKLGSKGWSREDLIKANNIFQSAQEKKHHMVKLLDEFIYWFVLIVAIIGNLIVSVVLVPFLLVFHAIFLYGIISVIALTFGFLFIVIIDDSGSGKPANLQNNFALSSGLLTKVFFLLIISKDLIAEARMLGGKAVV